MTAARTTAALGSGCSDRWRGTRGSCPGSCSAPSSTCRATRWPSPGSDCRRCALARALRAAGSAGRRRARCSPAWRRTRCVALDRPLSASFGLVLGMYAHAVGWPMIRGGSAAVTDALAAELRGLGGEIVTGERVGPTRPTPGRAGRPVRHDPAAPRRDRRRPPAATDPAPVRGASATARACSRSTGRSTAPSRGRPTACGARPRSTWAARWTRSRASESEVAAGRHPERPFTLLVQYHPWDPTRAPAGKTTAWAYCHVPSGSTVDMTDRIEAQVERFAPGFRDLILARATRSPAQTRGLRRELRRRRHQRGHRGHPPAPVPPGRRAWTRTTPAPGCTCARHRPRPAAASTA